MKYQFILAKDISVSEKSIVYYYWRLDGDNFVNKSTDVATKYGITVFDLKNVIKYNSHYLVTDKPCHRCNRLKTCKVYSQGGYTQILKNTALKCDNCVDDDFKAYFNRKEAKQVEARRSQLERHKIEMRKSRLNALPDEERDLWGLLYHYKIKTIREFKRHILQGSWVGNIGILKQLASLESKNLLVLTHDRDRILQGLFIARIKRQKATVSANKIKTNKETADSPRTRRLHWALIPEKSGAPKSSQDYSGSFVLEADLVLKKGQVLRYYGHQTPFEDIIVVIQTATVKQPKLLSETQYDASDFDNMNFNM